MVLNEEGWHTLSVEILSALLKRITSNYDEDFNCLNYLHLFRTKNKLE